MNAQQHSGHNMYVFAELLIVSAMQGCMAEGICAGPSLLTAEEVQQTLDAHNSARAYAGKTQAANLHTLTWNDDLASRAQDWADLCIWKHDLRTECDGVTSVGQNLYEGNGYFVPNIIDAWTHEQNNYNYATHGCNGGAMCGHYTQVVWAKTREVGCGINLCHTMNGAVIQRPKFVFACHYSPPGNYAGTRPYMQGAPCSECSSVMAASSDSYLCEDNQCKPCTPAVDGEACVCEKECQNGGELDANQCHCSCTKEFYGDQCEKECKCVDLYNCAGYASFCADKQYRVFLTNRCPVYCGLCDRPASCAIAG